MEQEVKELLKAIEDNTIETELYENEIYSVVPLQYIADELEQVKEILGYDKLQKIVSKKLMQIKKEKGENKNGRRR